MAMAIENKVGFKEDPIKDTESAGAVATKEPAAEQSCEAESGEKKGHEEAPKAEEQPAEQSSSSEQTGGGAAAGGPSGPTEALSPGLVPPNLDTQDGKTTDGDDMETEAAKLEAEAAQMEAALAQIKEAKLQLSPTGQSYPFSFTDGRVAGPNRAALSMQDLQEQLTASLDLRPAVWKHWWLRALALP
jgi:hypothetical protein